MDNKGKFVDSQKVNYKIQNKKRGESRIVAMSFCEPRSWVL